MSIAGIGHNHPPAPIEPQQPPRPILPPLLCTISEAAACISRSPRSIYEMVAVGDICAVKSGKRTLVTVESLRAYVQRLPPARIKAMERKHKQRKRRLQEVAT